MERDDACCAQDRLSQPPHAEQQEQKPDHELQEAERDMVEKRSEYRDDERQYQQARQCPKPGRPPTANDSDGEDDRQSFDRLDQRGQESGRNYRPHERQAANHPGSPLLADKGRAIRLFGPSPAVCECRHEAIPSRLRGFSAHSVF
jgi:hypothetical protein